METIDDETTAAALTFIDKAHKEGNPFFVWYNTTAMHFRTHCAEKHKGKSGQGDYNDVMVAHDEHIGEMLNKLDTLGIADNTIVMYSTDNGPHYNSWPDAYHAVPRREEHQLGRRLARTGFRSLARQDQGGYRAQRLGFPSGLAADAAGRGGEPDINTKLLSGHQAGDKTFKVHIDGVNMLPYLAGEVKEARGSSSSTSVTTATF